MLIAGALAILMLAGGACLCGGMGLLLAGAPTDDLNNETAMGEGMTLGAQATSEQCIVQAHERTVACGTMAFTCIDAAEAFLRACLRAVPNPDPGLCDNVPAPTTFGDWGFGNRICAQRGWNAEDGDCDPIADGISIYCHSQP